MEHNVNVILDTLQSETHVNNAIQHALNAQANLQISVHLVSILHSH